MNWHITNFATREIASLHCSKQWWDNAFSVLRTEGADAWHVWMYGA